MLSASLGICQNSDRAGPGYRYSDEHLINPILKPPQIQTSISGPSWDPGTITPLLSDNVENQGSPST
jgi:hypothetical protein